MPKNIKYRLSLPIKPTQKPDGQDISAVALAALDIAQHSLLSPAAVISALRCSLEVYERNVEARGFDPKTIAACEDLGMKMAQTLLESRVGAQNAKLVDSTGGQIVTGLVDAQGNPLEVEADEHEDEPEEAA